MEEQLNLLVSSVRNRVEGMTSRLDVEKEDDGGLLGGVNCVCSLIRFVYQNGGVQDSLMLPPMIGDYKGSLLDEIDCATPVKSESRLRFLDCSPLSSVSVSNKSAIAMAYPPNLIGSKTLSVMRRKSLDYRPLDSSPPAVFFTPNRRQSEPMSADGRLMRNSRNTADEENAPTMVNRLLLTSLDGKRKTNSTTYTEGKGTVTLESCCISFIDSLRKKHEANQHLCSELQNLGDGLTAEIENLIENLKPVETGFYTQPCYEVRSPSQSPSLKSVTISLDAEDALTESILNDEMVETMVMTEIQNKAQVATLNKNLFFNTYSQYILTASSYSKALFYVIPPTRRDGSNNRMWNSVDIVLTDQPSSSCNNCDSREVSLALKFLMDDPITGDRTFVIELPNQVQYPLSFFMYNDEGRDYDRPGAQSWESYKIAEPLVHTLKDGQLVLGERVFLCGVTLSVIGLEDWKDLMVYLLEKNNEALKDCLFSYHRMVDHRIEHEEVMVNARCSALPLKKCATFQIQETSGLKRILYPYGGSSFFRVTFPGHYSINNQGIVMELK